MKIFVSVGSNKCAVIVIINPLLFCLSLSLSIFEHLYHSFDSLRKGKIRRMSHADYYFCESVKYGENVQLVSSPTFSPHRPFIHSPSMVT